MIIIIFWRGGGGGGGVLIKVQRTDTIQKGSPTIDQDIKVYVYSK